MAKAKEWTVVPTTKEGFDNERMIFAYINIPPALYERTKVEVVYEAPIVGDGIEAMEEFCQKRYECDLQTIINRGIRSASTGPDYPSFIAETETVDGRKTYTGFKPEVLDENGELDVEKAARLYQDAADNCVLSGRREPGKATIVKKKAQKLDSLNQMAKDLGYDSVEAFMAAQAG